MRAAPAPTALAALTILWACGADVSGGASGAGVTVRDSAGVTIVENHDSAWTAETRWSIATEPDLVIGSVDGSVPGTDWGGRIDARAAGDRVVVSDGQSAELRLFGADGAYLRTLSRQGQGPNELRTVSQLAAFGDTAVAAWDPAGRKVVRFNLETGEAVSHATGEPPSDAGDDFPFRGMSPWVLHGWFADGTYLVANEVPGMGLPEGMHHLLRESHRMSASGQHLGLIGEFSNSEVWSDGGSSLPITFGARGSIAAYGDAVLQAYPAEEFVFNEYSFEGALQRSVRVDRALSPVTPELMTRMDEATELSNAALVRNMPDAAAESFRERMERMAAQRPSAELVPPFSDLHGAKDGTVWATLYDPDQNIELATASAEGRPPRASTSWAVFDGEGRWLGTLRAPPGLQVTDITTDYILGFRRNELDVSFIERYPLLKPQ